ncbi:MAG: alpha-E domain-containing protein [Gammaproteobacteria bacterium]|nr:MAG: alpha-E domain-containing protein [Gammaproteobacteria bacterium]RLA10495.1 MAG: alpha-E domain-containing protein [Gammaproteobacteria bacterium]
MTMLSRVAERLYWMARYLERAEDTARLTSAYAHLIMDIPVGTSPGWDTLVHIMDGDEQFNAHHRVYNEQNVLRFLIANEENPASIRFAIKAARENVRTTRDQLPAEAWEHVNELYLYSEEMAEKSVGRRNRYAFLEQIITRCQMINGLVLTTLSRDHAYRFIKLGHLIERSDMTTRVIDVGTGAILTRQTPDAAIDPLLWGYLLQALSAMGAYRRAIGPQLEAAPVIDFMFSASQFPRSLQFCLRGIREELTPLRNAEEVIALLDRTHQKLSRFEAHELSLKEIHQFIDDFQLALNQLSGTITAAWFRPETS